MLAREFRLSKTLDIRRVFQRGSSCASPFFSIKFLRNPSPTSGFRFAVIVPNKISKKAVVRNRIKRRLREMVRAYETQLIPLHCDITMQGKMPTIEASWEELVAAFGRCVDTMKRTNTSVPHRPFPVKGSKKL